MELFRQSGAKNPGIKTPKLPTQLNQTTPFKISTSTKLINNQDHQPINTSQPTFSPNWGPVSTVLRRVRWDSFSRQQQPLCTGTFRIS